MSTRAGRPSSAPLLSDRIRDGMRCYLSRTNQPQTRHAREQGGEPVGQRRVLDDEGQSDRAWCGVLAQAAGLSAMVSETCFVSPARRSPIVTVWPMLSGPRACKTDCTCRIGSPFQSMTMSPW